jgi:hypothetical protein
MVVTDSEEIPEDFPLIEFAMMMGEFGRIDSRDYQRIREESFLKRKDEEAEANQDAEVNEPSTNSEPAAPAAEDPNASSADETPVDAASE